jgi:hypothetical protein
MSKGYTSDTDLETYMDMSFTAGQALIAEMALTTAEEWIDHNCRHAWLEPDPLVETIYPTTRTSIVYLKKPPIKTLDRVAAVWWPGATAQNIDAAAYGFIVRSMRDGMIWIPYANQAYSLQFEYTPNDDPCPAEVSLATLLLAASMLRMSPTFNDGADPTLIQKYVVGGELSVEFRKNLLTSNAAAIQAMGYLANWTRDYVVV